MLTSAVSKTEQKGRFTHTLQPYLFPTMTTMATTTTPSSPTGAGEAAAGRNAADFLDLADSVHPFLLCLSWLVPDSKYSSNPQGSQKATQAELAAVRRRLASLLSLRSMSADASFVFLHHAAR